MVISISTRRVTMLLAGATVVLTTLNILAQLSTYVAGHDHVFGLVELLDVDVEHNIPSYFSAGLLACAALLTTLVAGAERCPRGRMRWQWIALATGFGGMALDEALSLHERLIVPLGEWMGPDRPSALRFTWVIVAFVAVPLFGLAFWPFWRRLPRRSRRQSAVGAAVYLSGALGMEVMGGIWAMQRGQQNLGYQLHVAVEETLEMAGVVLFIRCLLVYVAALPKLGEPALTGNRPSNFAFHIGP